MRLPGILTPFALALLIPLGYAQASTIVDAPSSYFDPPANGSYQDGFRVVGSTTPPSWSWGRIELLEGYQQYRTEGYNLRTEKLRYQDTFQTEEYPLQEYFGELNHEIVEAFNLSYRSSCVNSPTLTCADPGPTRPEARFVLLHVGANTAKGLCSTSKTPVLLVHGAMQNANSWLYPYGNDGSGNPYPGYSQLEGFVQELERNQYCTYAVTFGNFHGDNFSQAINLSNALDRIKQISGKTKVDVVAWSKGVVSVDVYLANAARWTDWGAGYFEQIGELQAAAVPDYASDIRTYVALSGPHNGIDLNWRHPYDDLLIFSTAENAPVGQGPVTWTNMMAMQCVTWGNFDSPDDGNPNAYATCDSRGSSWPDFFNRIYTSNLTGLNPDGQPTYDLSLESLNTSQGLSAADFSFDRYNISLFGSVNSNGRYHNPYLGQLQVVNDFRDAHPIKARNYITQDWSTLDTDYFNWYMWLALKLEYNPYSTNPAGWLESTLAECRETAYDPDASPCLASHRYIKYRNAESVTGRYATYKMMDGLGIDTAREMSGFFSDRLAAHGLDSRLGYLYVLHGTALGPEGTTFEIDGLDCPDCDPHGDAVLFEESIGEVAYQQLTRGWSSTDKSCRSEREGIPYSHLEMGVISPVWDKIIGKFKEVDTTSCAVAGNEPPASRARLSRRLTQP